jgi:hypothetical protein
VEDPKSIKMDAKEMEQLLREVSAFRLNIALSGELLIRSYRMFPYFIPFLLLFPLLLALLPPFSQGAYAVLLEDDSEIIKEFYEQVSDTLHPNAISHTPSPCSSSLLKRDMCIICIPHISLDLITIAML